MYKNIEDRRAKARELYSKNPETYSKRNKEKRENRKNQLYELFGNKCSKCGCKNLLEMDHINPGLKKNRISPLSQGISKTICELDNLQLLCQSCHKERSKHQRNAAWNLFKSLPLEKQEKLIEDQLNAPTTIS